MKAILFKKYGSADVLHLAEVEKPVPKPGEVLLKVHAACINSWDWELLQGTPFANRMMFGLFKPKKINILGCDLAGRVEAVGSGVQQFRPGDEVFGELSGSSWGGFAEYACAPENLLALKPGDMSFSEAAAIPQAGVLALQGLRYRGAVKAGQKVLINGAGGGVGTFAIQMAKAAGAEVTGVDSARKLELMRSLGADHVIDFKQEDFTKNGQRYDLILDNVLTRSVFEGLRSLNPGGVYVVVGGRISRILQTALLGSWISKKENKKMGILIHKPNKADLEIMAEFFEAGTGGPVIDRSFPLSQTPEAMRYFGEGLVLGKVVITIDS